MREAKTFPGYSDDTVCLWPNGMAWRSAVHLKSVSHGAYEIHVWRVGTLDWEDNDLFYFAALVWPKVWHKDNPAVVELYLIEKNKPILPETVISKTRDVIDRIQRDGATAVIHDADMVIDAREPEQSGQEN